ncbi:phage tail protein I [Pseudomonas putida]|uniref:phage tail protein I n=1 Tax=Pseudomonas putida TaxID=303 RepID=UPI002363EAB2|nr:phage tail protein I [Pseudomonas putida]MDD2145869.1 phage tail protein I [Pseudomonas putida]HDS1705442.1 phage tail protein I [Pseudomonas putida]
MSDTSLLPINRTALEDALAQVGLESADLANVLRSMKRPETCPADMLPWLAIERSVDRWDPAWSEEIKRKTVRDSFEVHQRKGTIASLRQVISPFADIIDIVEWFDLTPMGPPGTFSLSLALLNTGLSDRGIAELERMILSTKPVSRHLVGLSITYSPNGQFYMGAAVSSGDETEILSADLQAEAFADLELMMLANDLHYFANHRMPELLEKP